MAVEQRVMTIRRSDELGDLRREKSFEPLDAADLAELLLDALLQ
jgi:hypothetical protein